MRPVGGSVAVGNRQTCGFIATPEEQLPLGGKDADDPIGGQGRTEPTVAGGVAGGVDQSVHRRARRIAQHNLVATVAIAGPRGQLQVGVVAKLEAEGGGVAGQPQGRAGGQSCAAGQRRLGRAIAQPPAAQVYRRRPGVDQPHRLVGVVEGVAVVEDAVDEDGGRGCG